MESETSPVLGIHVAASFLALDPDRGSEPGNGWAWLEQISRRVSKITAVVLPDDAERLSGDPRLASNVHMVSPTVVLPARSRLPIPSYYLGYAGAHAAMGHLMRDLDAHVSHQVTLATPYWGTELSQAPGVRVLGPVGVSRPAPLWATRFLGGSDLGMEWARRALVRYPKPPVSANAALLAADQILAVDRATASRARRMGKAATLMMADGAHPVPSPSMRLGGRGDYFVWAGRMMPRKGCVAVIRAFSRARDRLPGDIRLIVIGDGPERRAVETATRELGLIRKVELTGPLPRAELLDTLSVARALVFSSLRDTFGGIVLEAAERATPTVWASHSGVDGLRDWLPRSAGWSRPAKSAQGFLHALSDGMIACSTASEPDWEVRSGAAYSFAVQHSWERRGDDLARLYARLLNGGTT